MNVRTADNLFKADATGPIFDDKAETFVAPKKQIDAAPKPERFLLCSKSENMAEKVRRSLDDAADIVIDVAKQSLIELAKSDLGILDDHDLVVVEIDPETAAEMDALRRVISLTSNHIRFLAITPKELTITVARELMDAGVLEVLPMTALRDTKSDAGQNVQTENAKPTRNGMVLAIAQTRGGIGATTLAANLASLLAAPKSRRDKTSRPKVALLDLDFQNGDAAASLDIEDNGALIEMLKERKDPNAAFLRRAMVQYKDQFDVLPTPIEFAPFDALKPEQMTMMIAELRELYDYVILGLPRSMVLWIAPVLACADQMLLVTDTSVTGIRQARRLMDFYTEDNASMPLEIVISREKKPLSHPKAVKEAAKFLDKSFDIWLPDDSRTAGKATDRGEPMVEVAKRSAVVKPLKKIVAMLEDIQTSQKRRKA